MKIFRIIGALINILAGLIMLFFAIYPLTQGKVNIGMVVGLGIGGIVCLAVGVAIFAIGGRVTQDRKLLATGLPGTAVIKGIRETGVSLQNGYVYIHRVRLGCKCRRNSVYG